MHRSIQMQSQYLLAAYKNMTNFSPADPNMWMEYNAFI
jgi:hypothetical protein